MSPSILNFDMEVFDSALDMVVSKNLLVWK